MKHPPNLRIHRISSSAFQDDDVVIITLKREFIPHTIFTIPTRPIKVDIPTMFAGIAHPTLRRINWPIGTSVNRLKMLDQGVKMCNA